MFATYQRSVTSRMPIMATKIETFGEYIRRHRKRLDLKQEVLAQRAGISQSYVSGIERGVNVEVDAPIVQSLADALGVARSEAMQIALGGAGFKLDTTYIGDAAIAERVERIKGLTPIEREAALEAVDTYLNAIDRLSARSVGVIGRGDKADAGRYGDAQTEADKAVLRELTDEDFEE